MFAQNIKATSTTAEKKKIQCPYCKGKGKADFFVRCVNCITWSDEYKKKKACNECKDFRRIYEKAKTCYLCEGAGKVDEEWEYFGFDKSKIDSLMNEARSNPLPEGNSTEPLSDEEATKLFNRFNETPKVNTSDNHISTRTNLSSEQLKKTKFFKKNALIFDSSLVDGSYTVIGKKGLIYKGSVPYIEFYYNNNDESINYFVFGNETIVKADGDVLANFSMERSVLYFLISVSRKQIQKIDWNFRFTENRYITIYSPAQNGYLDEYFELVDLKLGTVTKKLNAADFTAYVEALKIN